MWLCHADKVENEGSNIYSHLVNIPKFNWYTNCIPNGIQNVGIPNGIQIVYHLVYNVYMSRCIQSEKSLQPPLLIYVGTGSPMEPIGAIWSLNC